MNKDREFKMLENAGDKNVERLAEVSPLTKSEKERILAMSKKKLDNMKREYNIEEQVTGVERYNKPKWQRFTAVAASFLLVGGVVGTALLLNLNGKPDPEDTFSRTGYSASTSTNTDTSNSSETTTVAPDFDGKATLEGLFKSLNEINTICSGKGVEIAATERIEVEFDGEMYTYYRVNDSRFKTKDEAWNYLKETLAQPALASFYSCFNDDFSPSVFFESDGKLYFYVREANVINSAVSDVGTPEISNYSENGFDYTVSAKVGGIDSILKGKIVREDGKWKISEYSFDITPELEKTSENTSSPVDEGVADINTAENLKLKLQALDIIASGAGVGIDDALSEYDDKGSYMAKYDRVTDNRFSSVSEVENYFKASFTDSFLRNYEYIWNSDSSDTPMFKEFNGKLYYLETGKGARYVYIGATKITSNAADRFVFEADNELPGGAKENVTVSCIKDGGKWKIDSISSSEIADEPVNSQDNELTDAAISLLVQYQNLYLISGGSNVDIDLSDSKTVDVEEGLSETYYRITDSRFQSLDSVRAYFSDILVNPILGSISYTALSQGYPTPTFKDFDGTLYFAYNSDTTNTRIILNGDPEISNASDNSFNFTVPVEIGGTQYSMSGSVVKDSGKWKISDYQLY